MRRERVERVIGVTVSNKKFNIVLSTLMTKEEISEMTMEIAKGIKLDNKTLNKIIKEMKDGQRN